MDGDLVLWDSHAIASYLANAYGKDDSLYPKDLQKKALVDQRLYFDIGTMYARIRAICVRMNNYFTLFNIDRYNQHIHFFLLDYSVRLQR